MAQVKRIRRNVSGIILLDKPIGFTSNAALQKVRWLLNAEKAGHTGSLDPLATGVLPLCFGEATKYSQYLLDADKGYRTVAQLGVTTTTGDAEGDVLERREVTVGRSELEQGLVDLVSQMTRQVIQRELTTDSSQIRHVLREALKLLPMGAENIRIHVHPQDFELVKALRERHEETWRILEDDALQPGGCRVETEQSRIDASVETRMALALKQLFEQQRAQATNPPEADIQVDLESPDAP